MNTLKTSRFTLLAVWFCVLQTTAAEFFVAVDGNDQNPGTLGQPVATLRQARDLARKVSDQPRRIFIQPGTYYDVSVGLGPEDSGLTIEGSRLGKVILAGGELITNWNSQPNGWLTADLPPYPASVLDYPTLHKSWDIKALVVNHEWRPKSRYPKSGFLTNLNEWHTEYRGNVGGSWGRNPTVDESSALKYHPGDIPDGLVPADTDVTVYHTWDAAFGRVKSNDVAHAILHLVPEGPQPLGAFGLHDYVLWNTPQGMTRPGQWMHEHGPQRINYIPRASETADSLRLIAPSALTIIGIRGTAEHPARKITLRNLYFTCTTSSIGSGGTMELDKEAAVSLAHAEDCTLTGLEFRNVGAWGINGKSGNHGAIIQECVAEDCGAGGIALAGNKAEVRNNTVLNVGLLFPAGTGIVCHGSNGQVISNRVANCTFDGIACGSGTNTTIAWNTVSNALSVLRDGGGIYVTICSNYFINNNFITAIKESGGIDGWGIYLDEHTFLTSVRNNLVTRTPYGFTSHFSFTNSIHKNIFASGTSLDLAFARSGEINFDDNMLWTTGRLKIRVPPGGQHWTNNALGRIPKQTAWVTLDKYYETGESAPPTGALIPVTGSPTLKPSFPVPEAEHVGHVTR